MRKIVVGVDGSEASQRALQWAVDEARATGADIEAIHAWHIPYTASTPYAAALIEPEVLEEEATKLLAAAVAATNGADVHIEQCIFQGGAPRVLLERAAEADLLVVGSRGHGGFAGLLLGSVSQQVCHHAPCPVVIVP